MTLEEFIASNLKNQWIEYGPLKAYVRKSKRYFRGKLMDFFDIASVDVEEEFQGQGHFSKFMDIMMSTNFNLYVESILNPIVEKKCKRLGFKKLKREDEFDVELNMYLIRD